MDTLKDFVVEVARLPGSRGPEFPVGEVVARARDKECSVASVTGADGHARGISRRDPHSRNSRPLAIGL